MLNLAAGKSLKRTAQVDSSLEQIEVVGKRLRVPGKMS